MKPPPRRSPSLQSRQAGWDGLFLSPDQIDTAMGATGMKVTTSGQDTMTDLNAKVTDKDCHAIHTSGTSSAYTGTGWTAERYQRLEDADSIDNDRWTVNQDVVLFPSAGQATGFLTASSQQWQKCSNRTFTYARGSGQPDVVYGVGPVSNIDGTLSVTRNQEDAKGWACQRALTVANNVAIDVTACSYDLADSAVKIAHEIAAKCPRLSDIRSPDGSRDGRSVSAPKSPSATRSTRSQHAAHVASLGHGGGGHTIWHCPAFDASTKANVSG